MLTSDHQIEKLFDIACSLIDVISCVPIQPATAEPGPQEYLTHFLHLISTLRSGGTRYVGLLQAKIQDTLPGMAAAFAIPPSLSRSVGDSMSYSSGSSSSTPYNSPPLLITSPHCFPIIHDHHQTSSDITSVPTIMSPKPMLPVSGPPGYLTSLSNGYFSQ